MSETEDPRPPTRLQALTSWQANKVAVLGARMTARHMPLTARAEFAVLAALEEYGPLSQAEIGRRLGLDRNEVSTLVTRMESAGYLTRGPDPADRRRNLVTLTRAGRGRLEEVQLYADAAQADLLLGLEPREREQLNQLLSKLLSAHRPEPA